MRTQGTPASSSKSRTFSTPIEGHGWVLYHQPSHWTACQRNGRSEPTHPHPFSQPALCTDRDLTCRPLSIQCPSGRSSGRAVGHHLLSELEGQDLTFEDEVTAYSSVVELATLPLHTSHRNSRSTSTPSASPGRLCFRLCIPETSLKGYADGVTMVYFIKNGAIDFDDVHTERRVTPPADALPSITVSSPTPQPTDFPGLTIEEDTQTPGGSSEFNMSGWVNDEFLISSKPSTEHAE